MSGINSETDFISDFSGFYVRLNCLFPVRGKILCAELRVLCVLPRYFLVSRKEAKYAKKQNYFLAGDAVGRGLRESDLVRIIKTKSYRIIKFFTKNKQGKYNKI